MCSGNLEDSTSIGVAGVKGHGLGVSKGVGVSAGGGVAKIKVCKNRYTFKKDIFWLLWGK